MNNTMDNNDDIITLLASNGEEVRFVEIAGIAHNGGFYAILQPVELLEGMREDEALVFKVTRGEDDSDRFALELNDDVIEAVFAKYEELLDKAQNDTDTDTDK